ncbi:MAG: efflux RND transporter permease subunit [Pseudomonadota bacterium]
MALDSDPTASRRSGPTIGGGIVALFARHPTAPNLLMLVLILAGLFSLTRLNRQFFPDIVIPTIVVTVEWPGASAEDVERNILDVLEPELRFIDNVDEVVSYAREGSASISLSFPPNVDLQKAQADIEQAVSTVTTLPEDTERPTITRAAFFDNVGKIALSGPFDERILKSYAKRLRDGLLAAGIDRVVLTGARDEEIWIRVREADLQRLGLTLRDVSDKVRENSQDQPAGTLRGGSELQLRAKSDRRTAEELGAIELRSTDTGQKVFLRDVADIRAASDRDDLITSVNGVPAVRLEIQRSLTADTLKTMQIMNAYIEKARAELPKSLNIEIYDVSGKLVEQRLSILVKNGLQGLVLVLLALFVFLNARIAFWTAAGIPIAMFATLAVMLVTGQSINMVSMFGLIMMLGIVVDDAIVVGEQAASLEERGMVRSDAAVAAGVQMTAPVTAATLTTLAAFGPMLLIGDRIGDILAAIPYVAAAALLASLIECFLILPGHLRHGRAQVTRPNAFRRSFDAGFRFFRDRMFGPLVDLAYAWRYTTVAILVGGFMLAIGLMQGDRVRFVFFPNLPPENLSAFVVFAPGLPREQQQPVITAVEEALLRAERKLLAAQPKAPTAVPEADDEAGRASDNAITRWIVQTWNQLRPPSLPERDEKLVDTRIAIFGIAGRTRGENLAQLDVQLTPSEERLTSSLDVLRAWRKELPTFAGVEKIVVFGRRGGPPGRDVDVRLENAPVAVLKAAAEELKTRLSSYPGVSAIEDDLPYGKQEIVFELNPRGTALGFTGQSVGRQVRDAFEGAIATRFARGDDEITVRVMRTQEADGVAALHNFYLTTPGGDRVPLLEVVTVREQGTFSVILRRDGVRTVSVTADLDTDIATTEATIERLEAEVMQALARKYQLTYQYGGRAEESRDAFKDLQIGALLALAMIYIILGWVFASYWQPLAVMAIVPFGFVGAVIGHWVMGYSITIISMIGLLGLSGILVNDSIVLVTRYNQRRAEGEPLTQAITGASRDRLRAVVLTSLTTIGGLTPLMFETSRQAQFLIPLAVTIVFGLAAATILVLILVPSLIGIGSDIRRAAGLLVRLYFPGRQARPVST